MPTESHLEPRVARLETGLESLTKNVSDLANTIRDNNTEVSKQLAALQISVTQASGPKKTDWSLFISIGFFILALGSAVFWPLNKATQDNKQQIEAYHSSMVEHMRLDMHPVGEAKIQALMKDIDMTKLELVKRDADLDTKIQRETSLMTELVSTKLLDLDIRITKEFGIKNERTDARLSKLEEKNKTDYDKDQDELRSWRNKANGLSSPEKTVPLISKEVVAPTK